MAGCPSWLCGSLVLSPTPSQNNRVLWPFFPSDQDSTEPSFSTGHMSRHGYDSLGMPLTTVLEWMLSR